MSILVTALFFWASIAGASVGAVRVPGGVYEPLFRDKGEPDQTIGDLRVDKTPVTNREFLEFVRKNPKWKRSQAKPLFVDPNYLKQWLGDLSYPQDVAEHPVVHVSWFAARAYCETRGARLPTTAEWEYFSDLQNPKHEPEVLAWYSKPNQGLRPVGMGAPNKFGLRDLWGLTWEWVDDFSSVMMTGDSRSQPTEDLFCGGASLGAKDPRLYAAFIRFAFRSSLKAKYGTSSLGFRCVRDLKRGENK